MPSVRHRSTCSSMCLLAACGGAPGRRHRLTLEITKSSSSRGARWYLGECLLLSNNAENNRCQQKL